MSIENKPLSAEEILRKHNVPNEHGRRPLGSIKRAMKEFSTQQTAVLREELERLEKLADKWLNGQADAQLKCDDLIKELEAVKKDRDYQWVEKGKFRQYHSEVCKELEEQKKRVQKHHDYCAKQDEKRVTDIKELKEELEAVKKERIELKIDCTGLRATIIDRERSTQRAEALRDDAIKERDIQKERADEEAAGYSALAQTIINLKTQRDEAVTLLERYPDSVNFASRTLLYKARIEWDHDVRTYLTRISSGETKPRNSQNIRDKADRMFECLLSIFKSQSLSRTDLQEVNDIVSSEEAQGGLGPHIYPKIAAVSYPASTWISVKDRLPEKYRWIDGLIPGEDHYIDMYTDARDITGWDITHWRYQQLPAPESLTDKTDQHV